MARAKKLYEENGVQVSKSSISVGDEVTLSYSGLLAQCGAESVYAHIGYGESWEEKDFIPMEKNKDVFKAKIKVTHPDSLNIAFKDNGENWDNNSFLNYSFKVSDKVKTTKKASSTTRKASGTEKKVSGTEKKASGTEKKASGTEKKASSTEKKASSTEKKASGTAKKAGSTVKKASSTAKKASSRAKKATNIKKDTTAKTTKRTVAKKSKN